MVLCAWAGLWVQAVPREVCGCSAGPLCRSWFLCAALYSASPRCCWGTRNKQQGTMLPRNRVLPPTAPALGVESCRNTPRSRWPEAGAGWVSIPPAGVLVQTTTTKNDLWLIPFGFPAVWGRCCCKDQSTRAFAHWGFKDSSGSADEAFGLQVLQTGGEHTQEEACSHCSSKEILARVRLQRGLHINYP